MKTKSINPIETHLRADATEREAQAKFKAGEIGAGELNRVLVQGRDDRAAARQWLVVLTGVGGDGRMRGSGRDSNPT